METRIVKLYRFHELNAKAQQKIVNENIDMFLGDFNFYVDDLKNLWVDVLEKVGFCIEYGDIEYSGFCCQGDGLSFTCNNINTAAVLAYAEKHGYEKEVKNLKTLLQFDSVLPCINFEIVRTTWHYSHKYTVNLCDNTEEVLIDTPQKAYIADKIFNIVEHVRMDLCDKFYNELEQEWDKLYSFDYVNQWFLEYDDNLYFKNGQRWVESEA